MNGSQFRRGDLTEGIIRVFCDAYNEMGNGFLESVYEESMRIALQQDGMTVLRQSPVPLWFRGSKVGDCRIDLLIENRGLVEVKWAHTLEPAHEAQVLNYLKSTEIEVGLLLNFGPKPQMRRFLFDNERKKIRANPCKSAARFSV